MHKLFEIKNCTSYCAEILYRDFYRPRVGFISEKESLGLKLRVDKVNVSAIIDDPNIVTLTWLVLSRVAAPDEMKNPGVKKSQQEG